MQTILTNSIICGDCRDKMRQHIPSESVDLIYMDPPFFSGKNYEVIWKDGAEVRSFEDTEFYTLECECGKVFPENHLYCAFCGAGKDNAKERRSNDIEAYLQWLRPKLEECYRVLKSTGSIYVHLDWHAVHYVKVMMDEIFGMKKFRNEIIWKRTSSAKTSQFKDKKYSVLTDTILYYSKTNKYTFESDRIKERLSEEELIEKYPLIDDIGRYHLRTLLRSKSMGERPNLVYEYDGFTPDKYGWRMIKDKVSALDVAGNLHWNSNRNPYRKIRIHEDKGKPISNLWDNIQNVKSPLYPTEKPESLLERIIKASSNPGDIVLDPFSGCATCVSVAQKLGRRWIGIDVSPTSCKLMTDRLRKIGYSIGHGDIIDMPLKVDELRNLPPFEFQNWAVQQLGGRQQVRKAGDRGIDGWTFEGTPIQVKQSDKVGGPVMRLFAQDIRDVEKTKGIVIAFSYSKGAYTEVEHIKAKYGIDIELKIVEDMV